MIWNKPVAPDRFWALGFNPDSHWATATASSYGHGYAAMIANISDGPAGTAAPLTVPLVGRGMTGSGVAVDGTGVGVCVGVGVAV